MHPSLRTAAVALLAGSCLLAAAAEAKKPPPPPPDINTPEGQAAIAATGIVQPFTKMMAKQLEFTGGGLPKPIAIVDFKVDIAFSFDHTVSPPADYEQRIVDAMYTVFVNRAKEAGFDILPKEKVTGAAKYAELSGSEEAKIRDVKHADTYAPTGMLRMPFNPANLARLYALEDELDAQAKAAVRVAVGVCDMGKYGDGGVQGCVKISNCAVTPTVQIETGYDLNPGKGKDGGDQYVPYGADIGWCNGADLTADYSMFGVPTQDISAFPELAGLTPGGSDTKIAVQAVSAWDAMNRVAWAGFQKKWAETGGKK